MDGETITIIVLSVALLILIIANLLLVVGLSKAMSGETAPPTQPQPEPPRWPDNTTTGVPDGITLTTINRENIPHIGDSISSDGKKLYIRTKDAVYTNYRFPYLVEVEAAGARFTNCRFEGVAVNPADSALMRVKTGGAASATADHCTFIPSHPNDSIDGVRGSNFTLKHCEITDTVDGVHIYGNLSNYNDSAAGNVTIDNCWIHDFIYYDNNSHPGTGDSGTHNDAIQIVGGKNITITHNRFDGDAKNAVFMVTQAKQSVADFRIEDNLIASDAVSGLNLSDGKGPGPVTGLVVKGNTFKKEAQNYQILVSGRTLDQGDPEITGNVWDDGSTPPPSAKRG